MCFIGGRCWTYPVGPAKNHGEPTRPRAWKRWMQKRRASRDRFDSLLLGAPQPGISMKRQSQHDGDIPLGFPCADRLGRRGRLQTPLLNMAVKPLSHGENHWAPAKSHWSRPRPRVPSHPAPPPTRSAKTARRSEPAARPTARSASQHSRRRNGAGPDPRCENGIE